MLKRTEESKLTSWYFEIDRRVLELLLIFTVIGAIYAISAGSVVAEVKGRPWYFFIKKALPFYFVGLTTLFAASMLNKKWVLRISVVNVIVGVLLLGVTFVAPRIINGSTRFVSIYGFSVMPSDIMKPGFIMLTAWFLTKMRELYGEKMFFKRDAWRLRLFSWETYLMIFAPAMFIMYKQPDLGTTGLYLATLVGMLFVAGLSWWLVGGFAGVASVLVVVAFFTMPHVHRRIVAFLGGGGDTYQVHKSMQSIQHGGLFGGGDDAFVKEFLPDAHTDYIFATIVEDLGAIMACLLLGLLLYMIKRLIFDASQAHDKFVIYATSGVATLFGTQVCINLLTTLNLIPPKGMTLPFISYGGSSFVSYCLLFGMMLAILREDKWKK